MSLNSLVTVPDRQWGMPIVRSKKVFWMDESRTTVIDASSYVFAMSWTAWSLLDLSGGTQSESIQSPGY